MFSEFSFISSFQKDLIFVIVFFNKCIYITLSNLSYCVSNFIYRVSINFPSEFDLSLYFVTFCYGNVSHVVSYTHNTYMAAFDDTNCCTHPVTDSFLCFFVFPVTHDDFTVLMKACENMSEFTVAMSCLVLIHEVHIDGVVWDFTVELCVKVK